jgi:uncharacterized membrane protein YdbT with pleckstrin-like domain
MVLVLIGVIIYLMSEGKPINTLALLIAGIFSFFVIKSTELHRLSNLYEITGNGVKHVQGLINKKTVQLQFAAISDVNVTQNFLQMILGYGDVNIHLFSRESMTKIANINKPHRFMEELENKLAQRDLNVQSSGGKSGLRTS